MRVRGHPAGHCRYAAVHREPQTARCRNSASESGAEWERLGKAVFDKAIQAIDPGRAAAGGSTLATQLEKFRHSPQGVTGNVAEKLRQMASASLRAYRHGPETLPARRNIVRDYLNTVPLAAARGLWRDQWLRRWCGAWFGADFDTFNRSLNSAT